MPNEIHHAQPEPSSLGWDLTVPLVNMTIEAPEVAFPSEYRLVPFSQEEKNEVARFNFGAYLGEVVNSGFLRRSQVRLVKTFMLPPGRSPTSTDEMQNIVTAIVTALRLHKAGDVGGWVQYSWRHDAKAHAGGYLDECRIRRGGTTYALQISDMPAVVRLCNDLLGTGGKAFAVSLRRFNLTYARDLHEDRIIDLSIALEGCLLADVQEELTYRLAVRGAALLAGTRNPQETAAILETMYFVRSKIVHEGWNLFDSSSKNPIRKRVCRLKGRFPALELHEFSSLCEACVRDVLKTYLGRVEAGQSLSEINYELDATVLTRLQQPTKEDN